MNKLFLYILYVCLLGLGMFACTGMEVDPRPVVPEPDTLRVHIPVTRAVNDANKENAINTARLIVVDQLGKIMVNTFTTASGMGLNAQIEFLNVLVNVGYVNWYIICNERPAWGFTGGAYTVGNSINIATQIDDVIFSHTNASLQVDGTATLIPMVGIYKNLEIRSATPNFYMGSTQVDPGRVQRLIAKVKLQIDCTYALLANGGAPIDITQLSIKRMPQSSWIQPKVFTGSFPGNFFDGTNISPAYPSYESNSSGFHYRDSFYIPEYLPQDTGYYTYISAKMNLKTGASAATEKEYKLVIGNGMGPKTNAQLLGPTKTGNDVRIDRNTCYNFLITVVSYEHGGDQDLVIRPSIMDWDTSISLDSTDIGENYLLVNPSTFTTSTSSYSGVINIYTDNHSGWSATVDPPNSNLVLTSPATNQPSGQLKFTFTTASSQTATIKIKTGKDDKLTKVVTITRQ